MLEQRVATTANRLHAAFPARLSARLTSGFSAAFRHRRDGEIHLCRTLRGQPLDCHSFDSLPDRWVMERDAGGRPVELFPEIEAGFVRGVEFWSLSDLGCPRYDA